MEKSPIEDMMWSALGVVHPEAQQWLIPELPVMTTSGHLYRVDLGCIAWAPLKIAVELDGHETHSSPMDIARDRRRQRELERDGWTFIRFGGSEIWHDAWRCAEETIEFIARMYWQVFPEAA